MRLLVVDWDFFFPTTSPADPTKPDYQLFDWGHRETPFFVDGPLWYSRAVAFHALGRPLPTVTGFRGFWSAFKFTPGAQLLVADSNAFAASPAVSVGMDHIRGGVRSEVWLYDAHHDSGYRQVKRPSSELAKIAKAGRYTCEDWMVLYHSIGANLHVRYPQWKAWAFDAEPYALIPDADLDREFDDPTQRPEHPFDAVFVCRSGAWVPPWCDLDFAAFIREGLTVLEQLSAVNVQLPDRFTGSAFDFNVPREFSHSAAEQMGRQLRDLMTHGGGRPWDRG